MKTSSFVDACRRPLSTLALALIVGLAVIPEKGVADDSHYRSLLVGNRAAGMGGAYTAVSDDPAGLYYNPAGIVYTNGNNISASANAFQMSRTRYKDAIGSDDWTRTSSTLLPNFFGSVQPLGPFTVGLSYAVPDSVVENLDQRFGAMPSAGLEKFAINLNQLDNTYLFGPSIAYGKGSFSAGMTLYGYYRHWEVTLNQWLKKADTLDVNGNLLQKGARYQNTSYFETTESGVRPILGLMWSPSDNSSLGLSLGRTFVLDSSATLQVSEMWVDSADDNRSGVTVAKSDEKREYPWTATFGAAWYPDPSFMLSFDFSLYSLTSNDDYPSAEPTWNAALGAEYYLNRSWALRGGLFTNNANTLELKSGYVGQDPHVDELGVSFSTSYFSKASSIDLGFSYMRGWGEDQIVSGSTDIQDVTTDTLTIFISANYAF